MSKGQRMYPVIPVVAYEDSVEFQSSVGGASSLSKARALIKKSGYRIMWAGGQHELSSAEAVGRSEDAWTITVWP